MRYLQRQANKACFRHPCRVDPIKHRLTSAPVRDCFHSVGSSVVATGVTMINAPKHKKNNAEGTKDEQQQGSTTRRVQQLTKSVDGKETVADMGTAEETDAGAATEEITIEDAGPSGSAENDGEVVEVSNENGGSESKNDVSFLNRSFSKSSLEAGRA